ncbi:MAG: hypothetical protein ABL882_09125 [Sphingopyxis sp.]
MDIKLYREKVRLLADLRNGGAIFNGSCDHAAVIVENLFNAAKRHVRILSGDLDARVYGNQRVVQRAVEFLGHSDHMLDVIIERNNLSPQHPFVSAVRDSTNVSFFELRSEISSETPYHFMTSDSDCYRFEEEKGSHKAIAVFGDPATQSLVNIHGRLIDFSAPIALSNLN